MQTWFTADEHYGHRNILKFCNRPFPGIEEMIEALIERHNELVKPGDITYHIGDMFWRTLPLVELTSVIGRLNGEHCYILGNHEEVFTKYQVVRRYFDWIQDRAHIYPEGGPKFGIILDHFAGRVWHRSDKGSWQLYGHSHGCLFDDPNLLSMDVGVDAHNYYPVSLDQVRERMLSKAKEAQ